MSYSKSRSRFWITFHSPLGVSASRYHHSVLTVVLVPMTRYFSLLVLPMPQEKVSSFSSNTSTSSLTSVPKTCL